MTATTALVQNRKADRIGFLTDQFPVLSETFVGTEIRAVERLGRSVHVISFKRPSQAGQPIDEGIARRTVYLDGRARPALIGSPARWNAAWRFARAQTGIPVRSLMMNGAKVARVLQQRGIDHLHAHFAWGSAAHAIVAARLAGATVSFVGHGTDVFGRPADLSAKLRHADLAVATCEDTRDYFRSLAPDARIETVFCGIDPSRFGGAIQQASPSRGLIFVARLIERKGLLETLEALAMLPKDRRLPLDVVGDGPERENAERLAQHLGLDDVKFLGKRSSDWVSRNLPKYRALLAPYFEGADGGRDTGPLVAKEALASGVPVIASAFMGLKEIVEPSCGLLVPPRDVRALSQAIEQAASWPNETWLAMGRAGRSRALDVFTDHRQAEVLCSAFDALQGEV